MVRCAVSLYGICFVATETVGTGFGLSHCRCVRRACTGAVGGVGLRCGPPPVGGGRLGSGVRPCTQSPNVGHPWPTDAHPRQDGARRFLDPTSSLLPSLGLVGRGMGRRRPGAGRGGALKWRHARLLRMPRWLRCLLRCAVRHLRPARHAIRQAGRRAVCAVGCGYALQGVRTTRAARLLWAFAARRRYVRRLARGGVLVAGRAGSGYAAGGLVLLLSLRGQDAVLR